MATNPIPALIKEQYYTKVFAGSGDLTANIPEPKVGYFYLDLSDGTLYAFEKMSTATPPQAVWNDVSGKITIAL